MLIRSLAQPGGEKDFNRILEDIQAEITPVSQTKTEEVVQQRREPVEDGAIIQTPVGVKEEISPGTGTPDRVKNLVAESIRLGVEEVRRGRNLRANEPGQVLRRIMNSDMFRRADSDTKREATEFFTKAITESKANRNVPDIDTTRFPKLSEFFGVTGEARTTQEVSAIDQVTQSFDEGDIEELKNLKGEDNDSKIVRIINKAIPKKAEPDGGGQGMPDLGLDAEQAKALRQQMIANAVKGRDINFIPSDEEKANLWWWKEGTTFTNQQAEGDAIEVQEEVLEDQEIIEQPPTVPVAAEGITAPALPEEQQITSPFGRALQTGLDFVGKAANTLRQNLNVKENVVSDQALKATTAKLQQAVNEGDTKDIQRLNSKLLTWRDFDEAEKDPTVRQEILSRFDQVMSDPDALERLAVVIPERANILLTRAQVQRQEKQLADPNSALSKRNALEQAKILAEFQKLGLEQEKGFRELQRMDLETQKLALAIAKSPKLQQEDVALLNNLFDEEEKIIDRLGSRAADDADFKRIQTIKNKLFNTAFNTTGVDYQKVPSGFLWLGRRLEAFDQPQAIEQLTAEEQRLLSTIQ